MSSTPDSHCGYSHPSSHAARLRTWLSILAAGMAVLLFSPACMPFATASLPPEALPTATSTITPTPTIVWFPPTATATLLPTPVLTPTVDIRPNVGEVIFKDDFSDGANWSLARSSTSSIALGKKEITLAITQPDLYLFTLRDSPVLSDFYLEITAAPSLCLGDDEYGLLLRVSPTLDFFRFSLTCLGQIRLDKYFKSRASSPVPLTYSGAVPPGAPSISRLVVWAAGREMHFYVNDQYQFSVQDPSIPSGTIGLFARSAGENAVTISFSDLVVRRVVP